MGNKVESGKFKIVISFNGVDKSFEVEPHQAMQAVLEHALNEFGITSNRHVMALFFDDNREITDLAKSVADTGIVAGTKLILRQSAILAG
jgi:hypothetical protein